jgi:uncharacterized protein
MGHVSARPHHLAFIGYQSCVYLICNIYVKLSDGILAIIIYMVKKIIVIVTSLIIVIATCIINATIFNTKQLQTRQVILKSEKINEESSDLLIAYFSDLHYGTYIDNDFLENVINKINDYKPDVIIFGGDLLDNINEENKVYLTDVLETLDAKYGKYSILGDQDKTNEDDISKILKDADFKIIDDANITININNESSINIVGVDNNFEEAFHGINSNNYTIVVGHYPDLFDDVIDYDFDYMLAGHSHGGQIYIPLINYFFRKEGCQKYYHGKYQEDNKTLDITNGVGKTDNNARFLADAEIVFYRLDSK